MFLQFQRLSRFTQGIALTGLVAIASGCGMFNSSTPTSDAAPSATPSPTEPAPAVSPTPSTPVATPQSPTATASPDQPAPRTPSSCINAQTQAEINTCAEAEYQAADAELNQVYQALVSQLSESDRAMLTTAEESWIAYRDSNCDFEQSLFAGGSIQPSVYYSCLTRMTNERIGLLQESGQ